MAAAWQILRDERGNAMVEFAFVLPILLTLFIGVVEGTNLLRLERKVVAAAQTAADLINQRRSVNNAELDDNLTAAEIARKSDAQGKSVSERGEHGGRRTLKKK